MARTKPTKPAAPAAAAPIDPRTRVRLRHLEDGTWAEPKLRVGATELPPHGPDAPEFMLEPTFAASLLAYHGDVYAAVVPLGTRCRR